MTMRTKESIINAALLHVGHRSEGSQGVSEAIEANYDEIVRAAFEESGASVTFGRKRVTLTSRTTGTLGFDDQFAIPNDVISIFRVFIGGVDASDLRRDWEVDATVPALLVDSGNEAVEIEYLREGLEYTWSANFALSVQRSIEAVIKSVIEETEEGALKSQEADHYLMKAGINGSKERSARPFYRGAGRIVRSRNTRRR